MDVFFLSSADFFLTFTKILPEKYKSVNQFESRSGPIFSCIDVNTTLF